MITYWCFFFYILKYAQLHFLYTRSSFFFRFVSCCPAPPVSQADSREITQAVRLLKAAQRPLIIVGKGEQDRTEWPRCLSIFKACSVELWSGAGAAYARAEKEIRELVEVTGIPFLPTPMGKGVLPDDHSNCVAAARSRYVSKWSLQNLFLMEPTDVMWCPSLSVLELYCRLML